MIAERARAHGDSTAPLQIFARTYHAHPAVGEGGQTDHTHNGSARDSHFGQVAAILARKNFLLALGAIDTPSNARDASGPCPCPSQSCPGPRWGTDSCPARRQARKLTSTGGPVLHKITRLFGRWHSSSIFVDSSTKCVQFSRDLAHPPILGPQRALRCHRHRLCRHQALPRHPPQQYSSIASARGSR